MISNKIPLRVNDKSNDKKQSCSGYVLRLLKEADHALTYRDFGTTFGYGTLKNILSDHVKHGKVLKLPKENPARFILPNWASRAEYFCAVRNDKNCMAGKIDLVSFLERLPWSSDLGMHNLKLAFEVYNLRWLGEGWYYSSKSHSHSQYLKLSYPVQVQCYNTGTVLVSIKSSCKPFKLDCFGLLALSSLLGEVKCTLRSPCIPEPSNWVIVQWHLNRDSEPIEIGGLDFHITFRDFFNEAARIYYKHELSKVRVEVNQNPQRTVKEVFEEVLNRNNNPKGDTT